jgi:hypothetical protein
MFQKLPFLASRCGKRIEHRQMMILGLNLFHSRNCWLCRSVLGNQR